jgi:hypothetical protein
MCSSSRCSATTRGPGTSRTSLIIRLIIQTIQLDPSRPDQIDEASNVSRPDRSGADQIDAEYRATDLAVGVRIPRGAHHHREGRAFGACCFAGKLRSPAGSGPGTAVAKALAPYASPYAGHPRTPSCLEAGSTLVMPPLGERSQRARNFRAPAARRHLRWRSHFNPAEVKAQTERHFRSPWTSHAGCSAVTARPSLLGCLAVTNRSVRRVRRGCYVPSSGGGVAVKNLGRVSGACLVELLAPPDAMLW